MTNHKPTTKNTLPAWVFTQKVDSDEYRHEIRRVPKGFRVYCNVSEANGGRMLLPADVRNLPGSHRHALLFQAGRPSC